MEHQQLLLPGGSARAARGAIVREHRARPLPRRKWEQKAPAGCRASAPHTRQQQFRLNSEERVESGPACGRDDEASGGGGSSSSTALVIRPRYPSLQVLGAGRGWQIQAPGQAAGAKLLPRRGWNWRTVQLQYVLQRALNDEKVKPRIIMKRRCMCGRPTCSCMACRLLGEQATCHC